MASKIEWAEASRQLDVWLAQEFLFPFSVLHIDTIIEGVEASIPRCYFPPNQQHQYIATIKSLCIPALERP